MEIYTELYMWYSMAPFKLHSNMPSISRYVTRIDKTVFKKQSVRLLLGWNHKGNSIDSLLRLLPAAFQSCLHDREDHTSLTFKVVIPTVVNCGYFGGLKDIS